MSLRSKFLPVLSMAFAVAIFSTFAFAQNTAPAAPAERTEKGAKRDHMRMGRGGFEGRMHGRGDKGFGLRGIDLTDAQKAQIKTIRESNRPDDATKTEIRTIRESRKNGTAITPEQKERLKALHEQMSAKAKSVHEQILAVLTPEQRAQIETRKTEMRQRMQNRVHDRKGRPAAPAADKPKTN